MKLIKRLFMFLLFLVFLVTLVVVGLYVYVQATYNINLFTVGNSLVKLTYEVDENKLITNPYTEDDLISSKTQLNKINVITEKDNGYTFDYSNLNLEEMDIKLSDKECAAFFSQFCEESMNSTITNGNFNIPFEILQVDFFDCSSEGANFNVIIRLDIKEIKNSLNEFPLNLISGYIPNYLYISSTVIVKDLGELNYTIYSKELKINNLETEECMEIFSILKNFIQLGTYEEFNINIGKIFVDGLIGNSSSEGFTYSLKKEGNKDLGPLGILGVKGFSFLTNNNEDYYVIEIGIL